MRGSDRGRTPVRSNNDWFDAAYPDPATVDPTLFDRDINPVTTCWFKDTAVHLLGRVPDHLALLDRYGVAWVERRSSDPGQVLYEDSVQVVVAPWRGKDRAVVAAQRHERASRGDLQRPASAAIIHQQRAPNAAKNTTP